MQKIGQNNTNVNYKEQKVLRLGAPPKRNLRKKNPNDINLDLDNCCN